MIEYIDKDLTTVTHGIVAHGCNCQGQMGAGVALAVRNTWPIAYQRYRELCQAMLPKELLGFTQLVDIHHVDDQDRLIVANLFTQLYYGRQTSTRYADVDAIRSTLEECVELARDLNMSLYMPKIGCGLGGLDWELDVLPILVELDAGFSTNKLFTATIFVCSK